MAEQRLSQVWEEWGVSGAETGQWEELSQAWSSGSPQPPLSLAVGHSSLHVWTAYLSHEGFITSLKTNQKVLSASHPFCQGAMFWGPGSSDPSINTTKSIRSPELSSQLSHSDLVWRLLSGPQLHLAKLLQGLKG